MEQSGSGSGRGWGEGGHCNCCRCAGPEHERERRRADYDDQRRTDDDDERRRRGYGDGHAYGGEDAMRFVNRLFGSGTAVGAGALAATGLMLLASQRDKLKPAVVGTMKEYYRFADWVTSSFAQVREDLSDFSAEARHQYESELQKHLEMLDKERDTVQRLANLAKNRSEDR